jgi:hypothetical protein
VDRTDREPRDTGSEQIKAANEREESLLRIGYGLNFAGTGG